MSQAAVVLKDNWSISCSNATQYEGMKALLQKLGYTFEEDDEYDAQYTTVCSSDFTKSGVTQGYVCYSEYNHFENVMDFLVFHLGAEHEVVVQLEAKRAQIEAIAQEMYAIAMAA
ncbi:hypothetical protein phiK7A1_153 [Pseudomonas phage phiK7A1]|uniref:Uncharacterized protein n=1 Tax=Pseudomonas phage phiK7A1 TaxID=2759194 RepID=A0A7H0XG01_9CAUD|nr:hypothetical protein phiK7A1_153 [Pseudomonas phage phiK7A1]